MIQKALQRLVTDGHLSVPRAAEITGLDDSTIYHWIGGRNRPTFEALALLVRHYPCDKVRAELVRVFTAGAPVLMVLLPDELDVNHDGQVDADDALDSAINHTHAGTTFLRHLRAALRDREVQDDERLAAHIHIDQAIAELARCRAVVDRVHESQPRRRKARAPGSAGTATVVPSNGRHH